jgi:putative two-component system response regulator
MEREMDEVKDKLPGARILIIDDEAEDVKLLESILRAAGFSEIASTTDPKRGIEMYREYMPDLVLLDLEMEPIDGIEVMASWDDPAATLVPPILIFTGDAQPQVTQQVVKQGADDFIRKPHDPTEIVVRVESLLTHYFFQQHLENQNLLLEERVRERTDELESARMETLNRLALAAEYRDDDTGEHTRRVGRSAALLAEAIGLSSIEIENIGKAAPLHDVGKIGIPDGVLLKPAKLTDEEFDTMKTHAAIGAQILTGSDSDILDLAAEIALTHHERWDGKGYPGGASEGQIALEGRIVALCDVFDALTHARPYKKAWEIKDAVAELKSKGGSQFDPRLTEKFLHFVVPRITQDPNFSVGH